MKKILKNKKGYSLLEMIVAVAMFATIFLMITNIYLSLLKSQRSVIGTQTIQEGMKYNLEVMSKELRTAIKSDGTCFAPVAPAKKIYNMDNASFSNPALVFKNKYGDCVAYFLDNNRIKIRRGTEELFITSDDLSISSLNFDIVDDNVPDFHSTQATVTISIDISYVGSSSVHSQDTTLQTSITSRYYE